MSRLTGGVHRIHQISMENALAQLHRLSSKRIRGSRRCDDRHRSRRMVTRHPHRPPSYRSTDRTIYQSHSNRIQKIY